MKNSKIEVVRTQTYKRILSTAFLALGAVSVGGCSQSKKSEQADQALPAAATSLPQSVPTATPSGPTANPEALVTQYWAANDKCRGGSGDNPDTQRACDQREGTAKQLKQAGWCLESVDGWEGDQKWRKCAASSSNGGKDAAASSSPGRIADLSTVRNWKCGGASGPFRMTFVNVENIAWGKYGDVTYSPSSPFGFESDNQMSYDRKKSVITIGQEAESNDPVVKFKIDNQRGEMVFVSGESGDSIVCKPA